MAEVIRSRRVTSRGAMLAGRDPGRAAGGGDGESEPEMEPEGDAFPEISALEV